MSCVVSNRHQPVLQFKHKLLRLCSVQHNSNLARCALPRSSAADKSRRPTLEPQANRLAQAGITTGWQQTQLGRAVVSPDTVVGARDGCGVVQPVLLTARDDGGRAQAHDAEQQDAGKRPQQLRSHNAGCHSRPGHKLIQQFGNDCSTTLLVGTIAKHSFRKFFVACTTGCLQLQVRQQSYTARGKQDSADLPCV